MNNEAYQALLNEAFEAHEASWEGPGWKAHFKTIGALAIGLTLVCLLAFGYQKTTTPTPLEPEVVQQITY